MQHLDLLRDHVHDGNVRLQHIIRLYSAHIFHATVFRLRFGPALAERGEQHPLEHVRSGLAQLFVGEQENVFDVSEGGRAKGHLKRWRDLRAEL